MMQEVLGKYGGAIELVERAATRPSCVWPMNLTSPVIINNGLHGVIPMRTTTRLLCAAVMLDHEAGDDSNAVHRLELTLFLSRCVENHPSIVAHLVALGLAEAPAAESIELSADLRIGMGPHDAKADDVRRLIQALLDETGMRKGLINAFRGERMADLDAFRSVLVGVMSPKGGTAPQGVLTSIEASRARKDYDRNALMLMEYMTRLVEVAKGLPSSLPEAKKKLPWAPTSERAVRQKRVNVLATMIWPAGENVLLSHYRAMNERRLAALALGLRWYAVEHEGNFPATLNALVPRYLPAISRDAMDPSGKPLRYKPTTERGPVIYSVSENSVDDGGADRPPAGRQSTRAWYMLDHVIYLARQPRPAPEESEELPAPALSGAATAPTPR
jgi:hypothetical protein